MRGLRYAGVASRVLFSLIIILCSLRAAAAQDSPAPAPSTQSAPAVSQPGGPPREPEAEDSPAPATLRGPLILDLRYDEDYSYLDGPPDSYRKDLFDPIKNIHLDDNWRLTLGGEIKGRLESETNTRFGAREPASDTFFLHRELLHADLRYRKLFRVFVQGVNAMKEDRDLPQVTGMENRFDVHQLFADLRVLGEETPLTLRIGRQELALGRQRLVSPLEWSNDRRKFDGVDLLWRDERLNLDFFYLRPVPVNLAEGLQRKPDEYREEAHFYGAYATYKGLPRHEIDFYAMGLNDTGRSLNANGRTGDLTIMTLGCRLGGRTGAFDYDTELAGQWGTFASDVVQAWMWAADGGYTVAALPWTPRIGAGFDYAGGDRNPRDGAHQTFNPLFPFGHNYLGFLDLVGRSNILASNVNLTLKPHKDVTARLAYHTFWLDSETDALYNAGGLAIRRNARGFFGREVGDELDLTIAWQIDVHSSVLFGYSHFWCDNFIRDTGPDRDADLIYIQYALKF